MKNAPTTTFTASQVDGWFAQDSRNVCHRVVDGVHIWHLPLDAHRGAGRVIHDNVVENHGRTAADVWAETEGLIEIEHFPGCFGHVEFRVA